MKLSRLVVLGAVLFFAICLVWLAFLVPQSDERFLASASIALGLTILVFRKRFARRVAERLRRAPQVSNAVRSRLDDADMNLFFAGLGLSLVASGIAAMAR